MTSVVLEPPCYGSVWPVVWGAGVRISRLPDSYQQAPNNGVPFNKLLMLPQL